MAHPHPRVLYLGRNQGFVDDLRAALSSHFGASASDVPSQAGSAARAMENGKHPNGSAIGDNLHHGREILHMEVVSSQKNAMPIAQSLNPTLIVIEASNKPDSRLRFCMWLRERVPAASIVAIGSTVLAYRFEFDGILRTPIEPSDVSHVISQLRPSRLSTIKLGEVELDFTGRKVRTAIGENELTPKECALLQLLMERAGTVVRRAEIINRVWETSYLDDTRTLDVHIRWLRRKIEVDPSSPVYLITRRGEGYIFHDPGTAKP
jgi:DNA-binding response OmpR family regulator